MGSINATTNSGASAALNVLQAPKAETDKQKSQFLQLLVAQLKGQNPLNPMEGNEFVAQLAQFTSLEELIKIRTFMGNVQDLLSKSAQPAQTGSTTRKTEA